jgi:hypothetical protein
MRSRRCAASPPPLFDFVGTPLAEWAKFSGLGRAGRHALHFAGTDCRAIADVVAVISGRRGEGA